jgi:hypothetical protein
VDVDKNADSRHGHGGADELGKGSTINQEKKKKEKKKKKKTTPCGFFFFFFFFFWAAHNPRTPSLSVPTDGPFS